MSSDELGRRHLGVEAPEEEQVVADDALYGLEGGGGPHHPGPPGALQPQQPPGQPSLDRRGPPPAGAGAGTGTGAGTGAHGGHGG